MLLTDGEGVYKVSGEENAMAIVLTPKSLYNLISQTEPSDNRLLVHVKLTDSCLRALEEYQSAEVWFNEFDILSHRHGFDSLSVKRKALFLK